jgi:hypothetical protein
MSARWERKEKITEKCFEQKSVEIVTVLIGIFLRLSAKESQPDNLQIQTRNSNFLYSRHCTLPGC